MILLRKHNCTQHESTEMGKSQNEAAHIVKGSSKLASLQSLYKETGWEMLASIREKSKCVHFYKMQNGMTPEYLLSVEPSSVPSHAKSSSGYTLQSQPLVEQDAPFVCSTTRY